MSWGRPATTAWGVRGFWQEDFGRLATGAEEIVCTVLTAAWPTNSWQAVIEQVEIPT
jgi:hypothetical protein